MIGRGLVRHCAACGGGHLFRRWFRMIDRCPRCDLRFERIEGHWTGDLGINTIVSFGSLLLALIVGFLVTWPDVPGLALFTAALAIAILVPLAFYPFSKTIWLALDLLMRPLEPGEARPPWGPPPPGDADGPNADGPDPDGTGGTEPHTTVRP
jgi:uncharacterized protein (DUF983 family)